MIMSYSVAAMFLSRKVSSPACNFHVVMVAAVSTCGSAGLFARTAVLFGSLSTISERKAFIELFVRWEWLLNVPSCPAQFFPLEKPSRESARYKV